MPFLAQTDITWCLDLCMVFSVSPKEPFPEVIQCTAPASESECEATFLYNETKPRLTCIVRDVKPAVSLHWLLMYPDGDKTLLSDRFAVEPSTYEFKISTKTTP